MGAKIGMLSWRVHVLTRKADNANDCCCADIIMESSAGIKQTKEKSPNADQMVSPAKCGQGRSEESGGLVMGSGASG